MANRTVFTRFMACCGLARHRRRRGVRLFAVVIHGGGRGQQPDRTDARSHGEPNRDGRPDGNDSPVNNSPANDATAVYAGANDGRTSASSAARACPGDAYVGTRAPSFDSAG